MLLQPLAHLHQFGMDVGKLMTQRRQGLGIANTGHHILALRIGQELAEQVFLAARRVAGENHPGAGILAAVTEHHGLHVDRGAGRAGDAVALAVQDGAFVVPGSEYCADGAPELFARILGERRAGAVGDEILVLGNQLAKSGGVEVRILADADALLQRREPRLERIGCLLRGGARSFLLGSFGPQRGSLPVGRIPFRFRCARLFFQRSSALLGGLGLSGYMSPLVALGLLVAYLVVSAEVYLATHACGVFRLSTWRFGPTELRILLAAGTLALLAKPTVVVMGQPYRLFDVGGVVAIGAFVFIASLVLWFVLEKTLGVRVSETVEELGQDTAELGIEAYPEFMLMPDQDDMDALRRD